jgi:hypothetical protein
LEILAGLAPLLEFLVAVVKVGQALGVRFAKGGMERNVLQGFD